MAVSRRCTSGEGVSGGSDDREQPNVGETPGTSKQSRKWSLNATLFIGLTLLSGSSTTPIALVPSVAVSLTDSEWDFSPYYSIEILEVFDETGTKKQWVPFRIRKNRERNNMHQEYSSSSVFASQLTAIVTLVTAAGKFVNGVLVDIVGARRILLLYGGGISLSLWMLARCNTTRGVIAFSALIEFFVSAVWYVTMPRRILGGSLSIFSSHHTHIFNAFTLLDRPATIVMLGSHSANGSGQFELGLYVTSLACRCGSLAAIPITSLLLKWTHLTWRSVARLGSISAVFATFTFLFLSDSPGKKNDPANPIRAEPSDANANVGGHSSPYHPTYYRPTPTRWEDQSRRLTGFCRSLYSTVSPSVRVVLSSKLFWICALSHSGATVCKSADRILGTYFRDTSSGVVSQSQAGMMTTFLNAGMLAGLVFGGKAFAAASDAEGERQLRTHREKSSEEHDHLSPKDMLAFLYCLSICMCYMLSFLAMPIVRRVLHLPSLVLILQVLATMLLGCGIAVQYYHIPALLGATFGKNRGLYTAFTDGVGCLASSIVWRLIGGAVEEGDPQGSGWVYGWAGIALVLIVASSIMVMIIERYLHHDSSDLSLHAQLDTNASWLDDEMSTQNLSKKHLVALSSSALNFVTTQSPARGHRKQRSQQEARDDVENLLGIDDDGSLLLPLQNHQQRPIEDLLFSGQRADRPFRDGCGSGGVAPSAASSVFDGPMSSFEL